VKRERINVAVTGYVGTGSSAVIDLLREFRNTSIALGNDREYEHIPFYTDHGLFDLGTVLMNVNSSLRSDTAISSFIESMDWLNNNNFGWFGSYKWYLGNQFDEAVHEFVESISHPVEGVSYSHYIKVKFSLIKVFIQLAAKMIYQRPVTKWGRKYVYDKKQMYYAMPTKDEFYGAAQQFVNRYFEMCASNDDSKNLNVYDHLIWPQQANLVDDYFGDDFKLIIVNRDARDLYNLNKNYWYKPPLNTNSPVFPTTPEAFVDYWKRVKMLEPRLEDINSDKVMYLQFEDLIYNYDETLEKLMSFLNLTKEDHVDQLKHFNPKRSIKNTQTYRINNDWNQEASIVSRTIPQFTYQFPYEITTDLNDMFDTPGTTPKRYSWFKRKNK
jgi:Sulfotransferase domain